MKIIQILGLALGSVALMQLACSGEGISRQEGNQCPQWGPKGPIGLNAEGNQTKISLRPENGQVATGNYVYSTATIYYQDVSGFQIQILDVETGSKEFKGTAACVRNAGKANQSTTFSVTSIYEMTANQADQTAQPTARSYTFRIEPDGKYRFDFVTASNVSDEPSKVLPLDDEATSFLKLDETHYEIRTVGTTATGRYWVSTRYRLDPPGQPPAPAPAP